MPEFLKTLSTPSMSNWDVYTQKSQIAVDKVLRYENLEHDLNEVGNFLGLNIDISLIHAKSHTRTDRRNYREVINSESRSIIEARCANEIKYFGYEW